MMHPVLCDIATEEMWVLLLNSSSKLIRKVRISCGGINTAPVDIRVIMKQALYYNAVSFIMVQLTTHQEHASPAVRMTA